MILSEIIVVELFIYIQFDEQIEEHLHYQTLIKSISLTHLEIKKNMDTILIMITYIIGGQLKVSNILEG